MRSLLLIKKRIKQFPVVLLLSILCFSGCSKNGNGAGGIKYVASYSPIPTGPLIAVIPVEIENPPMTSAPTATPLITSTPVPTVTSIPTPAPTTEIEYTIANMTIEEKIGQLVMFGFSGTDSVSSEFRTMMRKYKIGNLILYGPNIDRNRSDGGFSKCRRLTDSLRSYNAVDIPLLIAIDVEGGSVTRFRWKNKLYSAAELGTHNNIETAEKQFKGIGRGLLDAGINMDLAPVLDIAKKPSSTFLNKRIISSSPVVTSEIGAACIRGLHSSGCLSLVKHFPGHGATANDSHKTTPIIRKTMDELEEYELIPFEAAVEAGADGIMVGHLSYPNIDPNHIASQSYYFITVALREQMGFDGIIMSDDFRMDGLRQQCPLKEAAMNFILAGGDIILCGPNHEYQILIMEGLYEAYDSGILTEERIDESLVRILTAKQGIS